MCRVTNFIPEPFPDPRIGLRLLELSTIPDATLRRLKKVKPDPYPDPCPGLKILRLSIIPESELCRLKISVPVPFPDPRLGLKMSETTGFRLSNVSDPYLGI